MFQQYFSNLIKDNKFGSQFLKEGCIIRENINILYIKILLL